MIYALFGISLRRFVDTTSCLINIIISLFILGQKMYLQG